VAVSNAGYGYSEMTASAQPLADRQNPIQRLLAWFGTRIGKIVLIALIAAAAIGIAAWVIAAYASATAANSYLTQPVVRQSLVQSVTASGTVNPQNTIAVGTQVSGTISEIDADFNSKVKKGQVLAKLDPSTLQAQLDQASASLTQAQAQAAATVQSANSASAGIGGANATVAKAQSAAALAQTTLTRDRGLFNQGYVAQNQVQTDQDALNAAQAALQTAQSQASQAVSQSAGGSDGASAAQAAIAAQAANVQQVQLSLQRSIITSPVNGTVISRAVSVGQTVAASLQTPTLFTIAQDLTKMEVDIAVGEPDIGSVKSGEGVDFTVLAYPNRTFHGTVSQVREAPTTVSNVVTYDVVTKVNNPDGALLPGMTATATIDIAKVNNALIVPLAALQFRPAGGSGRTHTHAAGATGATAATSAASPNAGTSAGPNGAGSSPWGQTNGTSTQAIVSGGNGAIFVNRNGKTVRVSVRIDLVAGTLAAVTPTNGTTLDVGEDVIISASGSSKARAAGGPASQSAFGNSTRGATRGIH
jgi:HlyD family secretion protein